MSNITPGLRISLRGEDFLVTDNTKNIVETIGITELVKGMKFTFDLNLEQYDVVAAENTELVPDTTNNYRQTKLFIETTIRNASHYSDNAIEIANKAAIRGANFQFVPTVKSLKQPKPRILIADAVGLGKTVQVGIFMAELIRRAKGDRILVVTPKSILAQFQQEIWSRFSIPLVRLDSQGIARIKADIPVNKNPFDFYDKVIVSIDTLKNNGKFRHYLEKIHWDIIAIDECHLVANFASQRGNLARFLAARCEAMVLTSATPHNGTKENFTNLIRLLDPTAIPYDGNFVKDDIEPLFERRFKKDIEQEVGDEFSKRKVQDIHCDLSKEEEVVLERIVNFKNEAYANAKGKASNGTLLFSIGLFKAFMSSPVACLETIKRRLAKGNDDEVSDDLLKGLKDDIEKIIANNQDTKFNKFIEHLKSKKWKGDKKDDRIIIFSERRDTLNDLENKLKAHFKINDKACIQFHGSLTDTQQQGILEDFSKEDSSIRLFLASDAASQGVNLHYHCNIMFNYDIPWSIITLDQRNGRIDRFGQKNTPYIYYLIAKSKDDTIKGDIRILERLKEKEEEVHKSLGDAQQIWKLFDTSQEEKKVEQAIAQSDVSVLESSEDKAAEDDWLLDVFGLGSDETDKQVVKEEIRFDSGFISFYNNDFDYYKELKEEIIEQEEEWNDKFMVDEEDKIIEIVAGGELAATKVLYDLPKEAFPKKKDTFKLTTNKELVEKSIEQARKKKGEWPKFQLLYDLHPIARWMQFKLLAKVDKGKALVCRVSKSLPQKSAWYIFQGITSNGQGKPILAKTFVIGQSFTGGSTANWDSFVDFMEEMNLKKRQPTLEVTEDDLSFLKKLLPNAVKSAKNMYKLSLQGNLADEMEDKLELHQKRLNAWLTDSDKQLELQFQKNDGNRKDKRKQEVQAVYDKTNKYYEELFQLENDPFIRLLAVYYNA